MELDEKLNNTVSSSIKETKEEASVEEISPKNNEAEKEPQLSKCADKDLLSTEESSEDLYEEKDPYSDTDDVLLRTGEYYHDHENYPSHITFKHPFMNIISLLCGLLSSLFCICATPAPLLKYFPALWLILSAIFSILGIALFIFDLIKSKTVNGLSIAGLLVSLLGAFVSAITAFVIFIIFVVDSILAILGVGMTMFTGIGAVFGAILAFIF